MGVLAQHKKGMYKNDSVCVCVCVESGVGCASYCMLGEAVLDRVSFEEVLYNQKAQQGQRPRLVLSGMERGPRGRAC